MSRRGKKVRCICSGRLVVVDTIYRRRWRFEDRVSRYEIGQVERVLRCRECGKRYKSIERILDFTKKNCIK